MILWFNIIVLTLCALAAILYPSQIQYWARYGGPRVLIVDWGIYALTLAIIIIGLSVDEIDLELIIPGALLTCYILSLGWNFVMYRNGKLDPSGWFLIVANLLNLGAIIELSVYLSQK